MFARPLPCSSARSHPGRDFDSSVGAGLHSIPAAGIRGTNAGFPPRDLTSPDKLAPPKPNHAIETRTPQTSSSAARLIHKIYSSHRAFVTTNEDGRIPFSRLDITPQRCLLQKNPPSLPRQPRLPAKSPPQQLRPRPLNPLHQLRRPPLRSTIGYKHVAQAYSSTPRVYQAIKVAGCSTLKRSASSISFKPPP